MTAPTLTRDHDLLDMLDAAADVTPGPALVKAERLRAIQAVFDRDGEFDAARVRDECAEWARRDPRAGSTTNGLVRRGIARPVMLAGDIPKMAQLRNFEHRAGHRWVPVYRLTERVA